MGEKLKEMRCTNCGTLLCKINIIHGIIQRKCKCGTMNTIEVQPDDRPFQERLELTKKSRSV